MLGGLNGQKNFDQDKVNSIILKSLAYVRQLMLQKCLINYVLKNFTHRLWYFHSCLRLYLYVQTHTNQGTPGAYRRRTPLTAQTALLEAVVYELFNRLTCLTAETASLHTNLLDCPDSLFVHD